MDMQMTNGLTQRWVAVRDEQGREHLEAHWVSADALATSAVQAA